MKYVSIDLETTGLNPEKHQIIEFAAVIADTESTKRVEDLPYCRLLIRHPNMDDLTVGPYCAKLHHDLWGELITDMKNGDPVNTSFLSQNLRGSIWIHNLAEEFRKWLDHHQVDKTINPAGKNFASFDRLFLAKLPRFKSLKFRHRTFDPSGFFFKLEDKELPDTDTCLKRAGLSITSDHTALADARNVVRLCQIGMKRECTVPPENWACTRQGGHEGPCAAVPKPDHDCSIHCSAMMCNHANEMPAQCPCDADCYCKWHSCRNR